MTCCTVCQNCLESASVGWCLAPVVVFECVWGSLGLFSCDSIRLRRLRKWTIPLFYCVTEKLDVPRNVDQPMNLDIETRANQEGSNQRQQSMRAQEDLDLAVLRFNEMNMDRSRPLVGLENFEARLQRPDSRSVQFFSFFFWDLIRTKKCWRKTIFNEVVKFCNCWNVIKTSVLNYILT